jgi:hypothetical protein
MSYKNKTIGLDIVDFGNEQYVRISNNDSMRPFFMNIVSDSNHWLFVSSNGGITAGRKNPELALFPYYTVDKIIESSEFTGAKAIFQVNTIKGDLIWEPFRYKFSNKYNIERNIYKNTKGNKVIFEEINHDLHLTYRYHWNTSNLFGFVKRSELINNSSEIVQINVLDGIQNILPYGISSDLQRAASNLGDAYKRNELVLSTGMGIFSLSAMIVDKAEPSEALKANIVWQIGLDNPKFLLSSLQLDKFRRGFKIEPEFDIKGEKGAYFISSELLLKPNENKSWKIIANVNQNHSSIKKLSRLILENSQLEKELEEDIKHGTDRLTQFVASADGLQLNADRLQDIRHYSNVLYNIMRGGIFDDNYFIEKEDFVSYLYNANKDVVNRNKAIIEKLGDKFHRNELKRLASDNNDKDFYRLTVEYLPLKFSRRHGDPSRPWNNFTINTRDEKTGKKILDYEGNWRDLFQNWEALAHSYPEYIDAMILKFLNASTFDGYNPYRITKKGFDWETIEPDNPWSYIGYWGDHQVIYLLKFLEIAENYYPELLEKYFQEDVFVYAAVPYVIKPYSQLLENPRDTIEFDNKWDADIRKNRDFIGADGALITNSLGEIHKVNLTEKLLAVLLSKLSNFIPEAGIWMNTQRPEWNDANNALVGNGVSMVTLYYLRRFINHFIEIISSINIVEFAVSSELKDFYSKIDYCFVENQNLLVGNINNADRKSILDSIGSAASDYRSVIYNNFFKGEKKNISKSALINFLNLSLEYIDHSIRASKRADNLYHSYNLMSSTDNEIAITNLSQMLEGQVAVLSSGVLSSEQALDVLNSLKNSPLYREDQNSFILYPNKDLPGFLSKNNIPSSSVNKSELLLLLIEEGNTSIIEKDVDGDFHFNGDFRNANDLERAIDSLVHEGYPEIKQSEKKLISDIFEEVFNHKSFTGRSSTFFAYEGLGSIYWHMVSKLLLAAQEITIKAIHEDRNSTVTRSLLQHYFNIKEGIGLHKSPELYGAFPTDPYSHTPLHRGAQQPGMTGQVKEDILVQFGELGVFVQDGIISFQPPLIKEKLFLNQKETYDYVSLDNTFNRIDVEANSFCFTYCQLPIIYHKSNKEGIIVEFMDGTSKEYISLSMDKECSNKVFNRENSIKSIKVSVPDDFLIRL